MKFYTSDWRADPGLRMCSYAARGLWADLLSLMHEADPYGHLLIGGIAPSPKDIAILLGGTEKEIASLLASLEAKGVFSRTDEGVIYSRRMLRDADRDKQNKENGSQGGNPALKPDCDVSDNQGVNPPLNPSDNGGVKAQIPEARYQNKKERELRSLGDFEAWWDAYPRKVGKGHAVKAYEKAIKKVPASRLLATLQAFRFDLREQYIPYPATWLNSERWLDEVDTFDPVLKAAGLKREDFDLETFMTIGKPQ